MDDLAALFSSHVGRLRAEAEKALAATGHDSLVIQAHGSSEKLDALTELLRPFSLVELVRSGKLLMARGRSVT